MFKEEEETHLACTAVGSCQKVATLVFILEACLGSTWPVTDLQCEPCYNPTDSVLWERNRCREQLIKIARIQTVLSSLWFREKKWLPKNMHVAEL